MWLFLNEDGIHGCLVSILFMRNSLKHKMKNTTPKLGVKVGCGHFLMMMENMDVGCQFY